MRFSDLLKFWLPVIFWMGLIFLNSTDLMSAEHTSRFFVPFLRWLNPEISLAALAQAQFLLRKAAHVTEYAILAGLLFRALRNWRKDLWIRAAAAFLPALLFAMTDEYHQSFVASRTESLGDVGFDAFGAIVGILLCHLAHRAFRRSVPAT
ncbi:MAG: VanZ family protein [Spartobacteria bacterium]